MATSQVWAVSFVRDEADIIEYTVRHLFAEGIDGMIIGDNLSTDRTIEVLLRLAENFNLHLIVDYTQSYYWYQGRKMTELARAAVEMGADWIIPFDADEMFFSADAQSVAGQLREQGTGSVLSMPMLNYFATALDDPQDPNPLTRERWRKREPNPLNKVCFRWQEGVLLETGSHHLGLNGQRQTEDLNHSIQIGHFQNRSPQHLIRRIRNEVNAAVVDREHASGYLRKFGHLTNQEIQGWWMRDYYFADPVTQGLIEDPAPYLEPVAI